MTVSALCMCLLLLGDSAPDPGALAERIDIRLRARIDSEQAVAAERASDAEFLRRLSLDLIGRIPASGEVRQFLDDARPNKRELAIDRLLAGDEHARHFARVWRALLIPETEVEPQLRYFEPGLEAWLSERRGRNAPFDALVRELLGVPLAGSDCPPEIVLRDLKRPNPLAFMAAKNAEPAKIASAAIRLFLGVRLECAQCHDHPFDTWTQRQFWNQAAFFAGIERRGKGSFAPLVEVASRRTIPLMESAEQVGPAFLDQSAAPLDDRQAPRAELARWITARDNPFFARAIVNRLWAQLLGIGIIEPVDDVRASNPPSHPELLADLANSFASSDFDVTFIYRAICRTEAYGRGSRQTHASQGRAELFARMPIKPLSGEQFFDSLALAIGYESIADRSPGEPDRDEVRQSVVRLFPTTAGADPQTSVAQALALMNGRTIAAATSPDSGTRLKQVAAEFPGDFARQAESLYLCTLSRPPTDDDKKVLAELFDNPGEAGRQQALSDLFWSLLNSAEFVWNH